MGKITRYGPVRIRAPSGRMDDPPWSARSRGVRDRPQTASRPARIAKEPRSRRPRIRCGIARSPTDRLSPEPLSQRPIARLMARRKCTLERRPTSDPKFSAAVICAYAQRNRTEFRQRTLASYESQESGSDAHAAAPTRRPIRGKAGTRARPAAWARAGPCARPLTGTNSTVRARAQIAEFTQDIRRSSG